MQGAPCLLHGCLRRASTADDKGRTLEELCSQLLTSVPGFNRERAAPRQRSHDIGHSGYEIRIILALQKIKEVFGRLVGLCGGVSGMIPRQEYEILAFMHEFYRWPEILEMTTNEIGAQGVVDIGATARREIGIKVN
jgi:hypothetical protein